MRPGRDEYAEYYRGYVELAPEGEVLATLERQSEETQALLAEVDERRAERRYAPGKWSLKEVVGHVCDMARVFSTRALAFARGDEAAWPGVEQDVSVAGGRFARRAMRDVAEELRRVRGASLALFRSFDEEDGLRRGTASGCVFSARSVIWIVAGHERHQLGVIRERYLA